MIIDHIKYATTYRSVHPLFWQGMEYLMSFDGATPPGRYELAGDQLFALVQHYQTKPPTEKRFESHQLYADIQYLAHGTECLWYFPREALLPITAEDPSRDIQYYPDPVTDALPLRLKAGRFVVFYPQDGHKPGCIDAAPDQVIKVVLKIRLQLNPINHE